MTRTAVCFTHDDALDLFRGENGPRFGGAETQVYLMAKALAADGTFAVRVVTSRDPSEVAHDGIEFRHGPSPIRRGVPYLSRFVNARRAGRPYRGIKNGVVVQTIAGSYTVDAWRVARRLGLKFVYRMSCDADIDGRLVSPALSRDYFSALRDADGVIAQTEYQQQRLAEELGVTSKVVPSIVEIPDEQVEGRGAYVLWVGRAAPIKRPWIMIETARLLPDIDFVMVMPKEADIFWMSVTQEAAHVRNLRIVPGAPYFEMGEYYRDAAVLVGTSAVEGFPNVFLQAAAHGKPIVSLDNDPGGMLGVHGAGYCVQGEIARLRHTIVELMGDGSERARLGLKARDYVSGTHSPQAVTSLLVEFFQKVVAS